MPAAGIIGSVAGALISSDASSDAADAQKDAATTAANAQLQAARETNSLNKEIYDQQRIDSQKIYDQQRIDQQPWQQAGTNALNKLTNFKNTTISPNVSNWYANVLSRPADAEGQAYWQQRLNSGVDPQQVYQEFLGSAKYVGEQINPNAQDYQLASETPNNFQNTLSSTAFQNTDIGNKPTDYANPNLKNLLSDFSMKDFEQDPSYQYRLDQGNKSVENSAASKGSQLSGATLKALSRFGQNEASQEYGNAFNRYLTQKGAQYDQSVGDYARTDAQRADQYNQKTDLYNRNEAQRGSQYAIANDQYNKQTSADTTAYNRLASIAGTGQTANAQVGAAGSAYGSQIGAAGSAYGSQVGTNTRNAANAYGEFTAAGGNASAAGSLAQGNILNKLASGAYTAYQNSNQNANPNSSTYNDVQQYFQPNYG